MTCPALEDDAGAQYIEEGLLPVLHTLKSKLVLHTLKSERALDPGIKKNQPGSPRMEEEPGLPSRGRHYGHLREHVNFTRPFGIKKLRTPNMSSAYTGPEPGGHTKSMHGRLNYGARRAPAIEIQP